VNSTPPLGVSSEYCYDVFTEKIKLEWCGYPKVKKIEYILFILTECMYERDRHTDRQIRHRMTAKVGRARIALRSKKVIKQQKIMLKTSMEV